MPILDIELLAKLMMPRYDKLVSLRITPGISNAHDVMIVPNELGKMCFVISLKSFAPSVLDAMTYS